VPETPREPRLTHAAQPPPKIGPGPVSSVYPAHSWAEQTAMAVLGYRKKPLDTSGKLQ
jgi:hypothetical protein